MNPKITVSLVDVVLACVIWSLAVGVIEHFAFGRTGAEIFTRVYWLLGGAFGIYYVGWRRRGFIY